MCEQVKMQRRGLCWTCYRKLLQAGLPLPLRVADRESDPIEAWATVLSLPAVRRLLAALKKRKQAIAAELRALRATVQSGALQAEVDRRQRKREAAAAPTDEQNSLATV